MNTHLYRLLVLLGSKRTPSFSAVCASAVAQELFCEEGSAGGEASEGVFCLGVAEGVLAHKDTFLNAELVVSGEVVVEEEARVFCEAVGAVNARLLAALLLYGNAIMILYCADD